MIFVPRPTLTCLTLLSALITLLSASGAFAAESQPHKKASKNYKITGRIQAAFSTDRNAGLAPVLDTSQTMDDEESEEEEDAAGDDMLDELDLDDQDLNEQIDESVDEDGDGDFFEDEDFVTDPSGSSVPAAGRQSIRDERMTYSAQLGYTQKIGGWAKEWKSNARLASTDFDRLSANDTVLFGINSGPVFPVDSLKGTLQPSAIFASLSKDGDHIFSNYGGGINGRFKLADAWNLNLRVGYDVRTFNDPSVDTIRAHWLGSRLTYKLAGKQRLFAGFSSRMEDTSDQSLARARDQYVFSVGYQKKWDSGLYVRPQLAYTHLERRGAARATDPVRQDDRLNLGVALGMAFDHGIQAELQYGSVNTDTNLPNRDSSNDRWVLVTGWKF
jgi:hypothetical protein